MTTHALLGLRAEIIRTEDGSAQSISIVEPQNDNEINLTLIFDLESGNLITAQAGRVELPADGEVRLNEGSED